MGTNLANIKTNLTDRENFPVLELLCRSKYDPAGLVFKRSFAWALESDSWYQFTESVTEATDVFLSAVQGSVAAVLLAVFVVLVRVALRGLDIDAVG